MPVRYERWSLLTQINGYRTFESTVRAHMMNNDPINTNRLFDFCLYPSIGEDLYFVRMTAFFSPDVTGNHTFWFMGDDWALLFIGESSDNTQLVTSLSRYTSVYKTKYSGIMHLVKDRMYYMEVLFYDIGGNDWLSLTMVRPGDEDRINVSFDYLYPADDF
ncbi:uncharacterized protein [Clytia hemisphaerica]|uniref:uncharacterized protein n=1 Tax=Clytia hemisphaerica TaxID=252671 RepID=UPI0034D4C82D